MAIEGVAGKSKNIEFYIYIGLLVLTYSIIHADPTLIEKL
jgi:hypothetical protein